MFLIRLPVLPCAKAWGIFSCMCVSIMLTRGSTEGESKMTHEQAKIAADALREKGHHDLAETLETQAREKVYKDWWQNVYDNDMQDLY